MQLAPAPSYPNATWKSAFTIDPFTIPIEQKARSAAQGERRGDEGEGREVRQFSGLFFVKEERNYANTEGSVISQTIVRTWPPITDHGGRSRQLRFPESRQRRRAGGSRLGVRRSSSDLVGNAGKWGEEAAQKLKAKPVEVGRYDLVLHPSHLWLTIHESIAHPTELDRAMGYEANYAGTSFVAPPEKMLGKFKYGPEFMNIQGDRSQEGGCATIGYDDEGVKPETFLIIKNGIVNDYQTTREQADWLKWWYDAAGNADAVARLLERRLVDDVQFQRMPNVSLLPGDEGAVAARTSSPRPIAASRSSATARSRSTSSATTRSSAARSSTRSRAARSSAC